VATQLCRKWLSKDAGVLATKTRQSNFYSAREFIKRRAVAVRISCWSCEERIALGGSRGTVATGLGRTEPALQYDQIFVRPTRQIAMSEEMGAYFRVADPSGRRVVSDRW